MEYEELFEQNHSNIGGFCRHYMFLYSLILGMEAKTIFEFGSGFSSKAILMALKKTGGKLISCDNRKLEETGSFYKKDDLMKSLSDRWEYLQCDSLKIDKHLDKEVFEVVLHDGSHDYKHVLKDLEYIVPKIKLGGILLLHDTNHPTQDFNLLQSIKDLPYELSCVTLPYGYGLTIAEITEDFGNGKVEIQWRKCR